MATSEYRAELRQSKRSAPLATLFQPLDLSARQLRHVAPGSMQYNCAMQQPNYAISVEHIQLAQFYEQVRHNVEQEYEQVRHNVVQERQMDRSANPRCTDVICSPSSCCFICIIFIFSLICFSFLFRFFF